MFNKTCPFTVGIIFQIISMVFQLLKSGQSCWTSIAAEMEPHQKYHWCLHTVVRKLFNITFQNVFENSKMSPIGYYIVLFLFGSSYFLSVYTIIYYDKLSMFLSSVVFFGQTEVFELSLFFCV